MGAENADSDRFVPPFRGRTVPAARDEQPERLWRELVGQVLRAERVEHGWTLQQISARSGVSPQYLSEVERGRKDPSSEMLDSICGALGLRLVDLLTASSAVLRLGESPVRLADSRLRLAPPRQQGVTLLAA